MDDGNLIKLLGGGGVVVMGYLTWRFQKIWRADIKEAKEEIEEDINKATGRIDKNIAKIEEEQKDLHKRISNNKAEINKKVDQEIQAMTTLITESNTETNNKMTTIIAKLSKIEGKLDIN